MIEAKTIDKIFNALDRQIGVHGGSPFSIVVCGGTALAALDLVLRTTRDVDVLGEVVLKKQKIEIKKINRFPQWFTKASEVVRRDFIDDLFKLNPSKEEMLKAAKWVLTQDDSLELKTKLLDFLEKKGFHEIIGRI